MNNTWYVAGTKLHLRRGWGICSRAWGVWRSFRFSAAILIVMKWSTLICVCDRRSTTASLSIIRLVRTAWSGVKSCRCITLIMGWILRPIESCCALFDASPNASFVTGISTSTLRASSPQGDWRGSRRVGPTPLDSCPTTAWFHCHSVIHFWQIHWSHHLQSPQGPFCYVRVTRFWVD